MLKKVKRPIDTKEFIESKRKIPTNDYFDVMLIGQASYESNHLFGMDDLREGGALTNACTLSTILSTSVAVVGACNINDVEALLYPIRSKYLRLFHIEKEHTLRQIYTAEHIDKYISVNVPYRGNKICSKDIPDVKTRQYVFVDEFFDDVKTDAIIACSQKGNVGITSSMLVNRVLKNGEIEKHDFLYTKKIANSITYFVATAEDIKHLTRVNDYKRGALILNQWGIKEVLVYNAIDNTMLLVTENKVLYESRVYKKDEIRGEIHLLSTILTAYASIRLTSDPIYSLEFSSAIATLKIHSFGPFRFPLYYINRVMSRFYFTQPIPDGVIPSSIVDTTIDRDIGIDLDPNK